MAAKTTTQAGPFTSGATWVGGVAPVNGDTLTINHAVTWTPAAGSSFTIGAGTGTAITWGSGGSLALTPAGSFTLTFAGATAGGNTTTYEFVANATNGPISIVLDATANTSGFAMITGGTYSNPNYGGWNLVGNTTYRIGVSSLPSDGSKNSYFTANGNGGGGIVNAAYVDFINIGDATNNCTAPELTNRTRTASVSNCTFDRCGANNYAISNGTSSVILANNVSTNSRATYSSIFNSNTANTSGTRTVTNCRWDKGPQINYGKDFSFSECFHGTTPTITNAPSIALWSYMVGETESMATPKTVSNCYAYNSANNNNAHPLNTGATTNYTITGVIFDLPSGTVGDLIVGGGSAAGTLSAKNCLVLPNSAGTSPGELISPLSANLTYTVEHNTVTSTAFPSGNAESGVGVYGENYAGVAGMYASLKSNYVYSPTGQGAFLARHVAGTVSNPLASPSAGDYNAGNAIVNATGSGVKAIYGAIGGYADVVGTVTNPMFTWTNGGTPDLAQLGAHDFVASANFVDTTRNLATFDTAYLGNCASAWATATAYNVGDIVSTSDSGFYGGATVNFRCILAHTSNAGNSTNGKPGVATNWRTNWEFASVYRLRTSAAVYSAGTRQATAKDLYNWVAAGWAPTNTALKGTAHDGGDIGAFSVVSLGTYGPFYNFICGD